MPASPSFTPRRLQSLCRLAAYTLLTEFLISLVRVLLPIPLTPDPQRLLSITDYVLTTSSMVLLVVVFLFAGLCGDARPARWEWWLARWIRPALMLVSLLYVLLIPSTITLTNQFRTRADASLRVEDGQRVQQLQAYRLQLSRASDVASLRRLIGSQPQLAPALTAPDSPLADSAMPLIQQREAALRLIDRLAINFNDASLRRRGDASGQLNLQMLRLCALSLVYGFFFALVSALWPSRLPPYPQRFGAADSDAASV